MNRIGTLYDKFSKSTGGEYLAVMFASYLFTKEAYGVQVCKGPSMLPTMHPEGELIVVDIFSYKYRNKDYTVGDVVLSKSKRDPKKLVCKRVAAVAGDTVVHVDYNSGKLKRNVVDRGQVWLTGDNPLQSNDSRVYGQVPMGLLMGAVKFKFWYRPLHFAPVDKVDSALASSARTPAYYYAKCYNMSRGTNRLTEQDWKFLYSILKDDKRCSNLIPAERSKFLQLAESKIGEKKRIKDKQEEPTTAEVKGVAVGEAEVVTVTEDGIQTDATTHPESDK